MSGELEAVKRARARRARAEGRRGALEVELADAIRAARASGLTLQAIADAAGITRQRVWQLTKETQ